MKVITEERTIMAVVKVYYKGKEIPMNDIKVD